MILMNELVAGYDRQPVTRPLSGTIERGSMTAIVGANGCGKSTLLKTLAGLPGLLHGLFLALLVLNLVAGFQVLGTLMAVGLMMLPAVAARCWVRTLPGLLLMAGISGIFCAWQGLSLSWAISLPAGPSIVLTASALFFISVLFGTRSRLAGSLRALF